MGFAEESCTRPIAWFGGSSIVATIGSREYCKDGHYDERFQYFVTVNGRKVGALVAAAIVGM